MHIIFSIQSLVLIALAGFCLDKHQYLFFFEYLVDW